jgi:hypothetical protein
VRHVALEIPLAALPLGRRGQGDRPAGARIEPLAHPFDHAALAGRVAAFEQHDHLELVMHHPVLQRYELALQAQQLLEIQAAVDALRPRATGDAVEQAGQAGVVDFQFEFLIDAVDQFVVNAILKILAVLFDAHPHLLRRAVAGRRSG